MATVGVVCEYNPFHRGHQKQLSWIRRRLGDQTGIVCVMSGNYVQRGEPAVFDKFVRSRAAVLAGADVVLELPIPWALSSAEGFARGAVEVLDRLGVVDALCFGSESADAGALWEAARLLRSPGFPAALRTWLNQGLSFPAARQRALAQLGGQAALLERPNDILAVEYCKALQERDSAIRPMPVLRPGDYHSQEADQENPSATAVRKAILTGGDWEALVPEAVAPLYRQAVRYSLAAGERAMLARLRAMEKDEMAQLPFSSEGLWNKIRRACREQASVAEILKAAKSRRYPYTRLKRMLVCAYLGLTQALMDAPPPYVRLLALSGRGRQILSGARKKTDLTLLNAGARAKDSPYAALERRAADLYTLFAEPPGRPESGLEKAGRVFLQET